MDTFELMNEGSRISKVGILGSGGFPIGPKHFHGPLGGPSPLNSVKSNLRTVANRLPDSHAK
jgi:hypothetical protein